MSMRSTPSLLALWLRRAWTRISFPQKCWRRRFPAYTGAGLLFFVYLLAPLYSAFLPLRQGGIFLSLGLDVPILHRLNMGRRGRGNTTIVLVFAQDSSAWFSYPWESWGGVLGKSIYCEKNIGNGQKIWETQQQMP